MLPNQDPTIPGAFTVTGAFRKHTDQVYPPKFVFFIEGNDLCCTLTKNIPELEKTHEYCADISESPEWEEIYKKSGHLPVLMVK